MADQRKGHEILGKDTSPLEWDQLSERELAAILEIERRLYEVQKSELPEDPLPDDPLKNPPHYQAVAQIRDPRVLLLDGGRGTGKTSLLLTLVKRWYDKKRDSDIPDYVTVLPIIDFDPLPPGMPLIAGIVQAWRPLAERYDQLSGKLEDCDDEGATLMDRWHRLFQVAAVGWTGIPLEKGLIEQILDREEQVQDWQRLGEHWQSFVNKVIQVGKCLKSPNKLVGRPVFVIMIDDVDLQVERVRELLPALRMLYHSRVVFLVAADRYHMIEMLKLDFLGQQNKAANRRSHEDAPKANDRDQWPGILAKSSFEKVFPLRNRWNLSQLSLHELLAFPKSEAFTFRTILDGWPHQDQKTRDFGSLGEYLSKMAGSPEDPIELPPIMPYRAAQQIVEQARGESDPETMAIKVICQIIGRSDSDDLLRITKRRESGKPGQPDPSPSIEYLATGELAALFPKGLLEPIENDSEVVLSAHPHFVYFHGPSRESVPTTGSTDIVAKYTSAVIAASLREDGYGVVALGLQWNIRLALAWTSVRLTEGADLNLDLAFRWQLHEHPSPMRLLTWTKEWRNFIHDLSGDTALRLERIAYAWIYHQLRWMSGDEPIKEMAELPPPFDEKFNLEKSWDLLLSLEPKTERKAEDAKWRRRYLPLMARPELGLPVRVQSRLLKLVKERVDIDWLWDQRRRLVTDAIVAAAYLAGAAPKDAEDQKRAERATQVFEVRHKKTHIDESPWWTTVEVPVRDQLNSVE